MLVLSFIRDTFKISSQWKWCLVVSDFWPLLYIDSASCCKSFYPYSQISLQKHKRDQTVSASVATENPYRFCA